MDNTQKIQFSIIDKIGIIQIDNPPGNFLVKPEFISLQDLKEWIESNTLKGILILGSGKHFSGGAKLGELFAMADDPSILSSEVERGKALLHYIGTLTIPVVAAIQGTCFGGGLEIALACHLRICANNALFAFPEVNHGLMPGLGGIHATLEKTSLYQTMAFILGGDMISAEEALTMKIVDQVVPTGELFDQAISLLKKMTDEKKMKVIQYVMQAFHNSKTMPLEEAMREETRMFCELAKDEAERRKMEDGLNIEY
jgi:enoyl-CoA hydratase/carnithine racemase